MEYPERFNISNNENNDSIYKINDEEIKISKSYKEKSTGKKVIYIKITLYITNYREQIMF